MPNENLGVWGRAPIRATKLELNHLNLFLGQYFFAFDFESKLLTFNIASDAIAIIGIFFLAAIGATAFDVPEDHVITASRVSFDNNLLKIATVFLGSIESSSKIKLIFSFSAGLRDLYARVAPFFEALPSEVASPERAMMKAMLNFFVVGGEGSALEVERLVIKRIDIN